MRPFVHRFIETADGAAAVEFALVVIPFFALIFATIWMGLVMYSGSQLQGATESAARCWSLSNAGGNSQCAGANAADASTALAYASARYKGLGIPTFSIPSGPGGGCGHQINGQVAVPVNAVVYSTTVTLKSQACFP
ncbi:MAG TPA: TadE/TadG family type IV pilus assembly protein [Rhizomicrobium sp.]|nr:TadE/TadG family type IV pilus assembly protein [Rhizomicrobium sp.]